MTRTVAEWIGRTDDTPSPPRVRLRVLAKQLGCCAMCGVKIIGAFICDHIIALINGGANRESNLQAICIRCDRTVKTPADVKDKAKVARMEKASHGMKRKGPPMPGSKASGIRKRMNGNVERRT